MHDGDFERRVRRSIEASIAVKQLLLGSAEVVSNMARVSEILIEALKKGNKPILFGNGGSAADAQHIAAEFVGRFAFDRPALPALALSVNTSAVTYRYLRMVQRCFRTRSAPSVDTLRPCMQSCIYSSWMMDRRCGETTSVSARSSRHSHGTPRGGMCARRLRAKFVSTHRGHRHGQRSSSATRGRHRGRDAELRQSR